MHTHGLDGNVTVTIVASYQGNEGSTKVSIRVQISELPDYISINNAINADEDDNVTVRGIVMCGVTNQTGFYLIDDTGVIAIRTSKTEIANINIGDDVIVSGVRSYARKSGNTNNSQVIIDNAVIDINLYGNNTINKSNFVTNKTFTEIQAIASGNNEGYSTTVFRAECYLKVVATQYYTNYYLTDGTNDIYLYAGSGSQYSPFSEYAYTPAQMSDSSVTKKSITAEFLLCNWNSKSSYSGCLYNITVDGITIINDYNFR